MKQQQHHNPPTPYTATSRPWKSKWSPNWARCHFLWLFLRRRWNYLPETTNRPGLLNFIHWERFQCFEARTRESKQIKVHPEKNQHEFSFVIAVLYIHRQSSILLWILVFCFAFFLSLFFSFSFFLFSMDGHASLEDYVILFFGAWRLCPSIHPWSSIATTATFFRWAPSIKTSRKTHNKERNYKERKQKTKKETYWAREEKTTYDTKHTHVQWASETGFQQHNSKLLLLLELLLVFPC